MWARTAGSAIPSDMGLVWQMKAGGAARIISMLRIKQSYGGVCTEARRLSSENPMIRLTR
jgi:hypothetical protein